MDHFVSSTTWSSTCGDIVSDSDADFNCTVSDGSAPCYREEKWMAEWIKLYKIFILGGCKKSQTDSATV